MRNRNNTILSPNMHTKIILQKPNLKLERIQNSSHEKTQKCSSVSSEVKLMNRVNTRNTLPKKLKLKKKQKKQIPEQNHSINKMKNALEDTGNRADHMRKRISELDGR